MFYMLKCFHLEKIILLVPNYLQTRHVTCKELLLATLLYVQPKSLRTTKIPRHYNSGW